MKLSHHQIKFLFKIQLWSCMLLLVSCAQIVAPTGGTKDIISPKLEQSKPENFSVNFQENKITLFFDEYIQVKNWNEVIFSPPLTYPLENRIKGKILEVSWQDTLKENTTYTINFGASVVDNNEGNVLDSNVFVFSTGNTLDTANLSGTLLKAIDLKPEKNVLVMLYRSNNDSIPYKQLPDYYTRTNEKGKYKISNIKAGSYKLFALKDNNQNFLFDQPEEAIAFSATRIVIDSNELADLYLFVEESKKLFVKKATATNYGNATLVFNKPAEKVRFESLRTDISNNNLLAEWNTNNDSLSLWILGAAPDSLCLKIYDEKEMMDTILLDLPKKDSLENSTNNKITKPFKLMVNPNANAMIPLGFNQILQLKCNIPLANIDCKKIILYNDKDTLTPTCRFDENNKKTLQINYPFNVDSSYQVFIPQGAFSDILGNLNDTIRFGFTIQKPDFYGSVSLQVNGLDTTKNAIIQLLDEKQQLVAQTKSIGKNTFKFENITPGKHLLKLIIDDNNDGKWNTGKYSEKNQPETIYLYTTPINIKSNWDMELNWELK